MRNLIEYKIIIFKRSFRPTEQIMASNRRRKGVKLVRTARNEYFFSGEKKENDSLEGVLNVGANGISLNEERLLFAGVDVVPLEHTVELLVLWVDCGRRVLGGNGVGPWVHIVK